MPIPTEVVGSLPRPIYLQQAYADYDAGKISKDDLVKAQEKAAEDSLTRMQQTGETYITDGEQRVSSFATYPVVDTLAGTGLSENLAGDGQYFAIFDDGHHRQLPRIVKGPFKYKTFAWENFKKSAAQSKGYPMKQAVIAPSMMYLLYPLKEEVEGYSKEEFLNDTVNECEKDIRGCFDAGAKRVSIDFTEGRLALKNDPRNPWTNANLLDEFVDLNNRQGPRPFLPQRTYQHRPAHLPRRRLLLPSLFKINAGYFLIQLASHTPETRSSIYQEIGKHIRKDANGVKQVAFVGVTNPLNPNVESSEEVAESLIEASKYVPVDQLGATDDFDVKPKHGGNPDFARDIAFQKIKARVEGAKLASEKLNAMHKDWESLIMAQIGNIIISPPLINTACAWASDYEQLQELYASPYTGAVTTRTSTLNGYSETPACGVVFTSTSASSLNSYGYSPFPLSAYIKWVGDILSAVPTNNPVKPFIISITSSTADELEMMIDQIQALRSTFSTLIAIELNTSCPNVSSSSPSGYIPSSIHPLLSVLSDAHRVDTSLTIGLKLPPYTHPAQFNALLSALEEFAYGDDDTNAFAFLTCTNTLGNSLLFPDQVMEALKVPTDVSADSDAQVEFAVPTATGGLAGEAIHALSLGNVYTFHRLLHDEAGPLHKAHSRSLRNIAIIGVGGVTTPAAYARMRKGGAAVVGAATLLGKEGVMAFEILSGHGR
ncbi:hypothetical protein D9757_007586 [Collybiopsis confluens]|uniref:Dihydroorotate dehydrogenase catalytic domain-containing protein n=1 Tax=Collybiopsis confluens TaxID=2823264 RepID=A0A8H5M5F7_9AGAR|nr:hypothetical protein D9757_007586 [Collybiopsis confluens]